MRLSEDMAGASETRPYLGGSVAIFSTTLPRGASSYFNTSGRPYSLATIAFIIGRSGSAAARQASDAKIVKQNAVHDRGEIVISLKGFPARQFPDGGEVKVEGFRRLWRASGFAGGVRVAVVAM